jgi:hypothetical protein
MEAVEGLDQEQENDRKRRTQGGVATTDVVVSAYTRGNDEAFAQILHPHVPQGSTVAGVTYGKGVFWSNVPKLFYSVLATDIATGADCRKLPYSDNSIDCVVLDPPCMEGFFRKRGDKAGGGTYAAFRDHYSNGDEEDEVAPNLSRVVSRADSSSNVTLRRSLASH